MPPVGRGLELRRQGPDPAGRPVREAPFLESAFRDTYRRRPGSPWPYGHGSQLRDSAGFPPASLRNGRGDDTAPGARGAPPGAVVIGTSRRSAVRGRLPDGPVRAVRVLGEGEYRLAVARGLPADHLVWWLGPSARR